MSPEDAFAACEATVRRFDPDRYFATLFAPARKRPPLFALYAFNHEIARAAEATREPMMAEIRLQWWREAIEEARLGRPHAQPVVIALADLFARTSLPRGEFEALVDARSAEISPTPFADLSALETHAQATASRLMRLAAIILDPAAEADLLTREAGIAYGLAGILRSIPFHAARDRCFLPADLLGANGIAPADVLSPRNREGAANVMSAVAQSAARHFARGRQMPVPKHVLPAILPASLVPGYLRHIMRSPRDLRSAGDVSQLRRQLVLLRAMVLGRL
ncbi:MAG TPA: phytoene/squalene synthase family protein [Rhizomicrobium sp.]|jgi:phytoene synthase|nr:phytoene/squalene synthase family protein [Rhizomicrobium sp.]